MFSKSTTCFSNHESTVYHNATNVKSQIVFIKSNTTNYRLMACSWYSNQSKTCMMKVILSRLRAAPSINNWTVEWMGVFLLTTKNVFVPVKCVYSVYTYSWISTIPWESEQSEWASPWLEWANQASCGKRGISTGRVSTDDHKRDHSH